jgi:hypothetical protein
VWVIYGWLEKVSVSLDLSGCKSSSLASALRDNEIMKTLSTQPKNISPTQFPEAPKNKP